MTKIVCTTDPISMRPLHMLPGLHKLPRVRDQRGDFRLDIYFESKHNRKEFLKIPVEPSSLEFENLTDMWIDEG